MTGREARNRQLTEAVAAHEAREAEYRNKLASLNKRHEAREAEYRDKLGSLGKRVEELKGTLATRDVDHRERIAEYEHRATSLLERIQEAGKEIALRDAQIGSLERTAEARDGRLRDLVEAVEANKRKSKEREEIFTSRTARIERLQKSAIAAEREIEDARRLRHAFVCYLSALQTSASWPFYRPALAAERRWPRAVRALYAVPKVVWWAATFTLRQRLRLRRTVKQVLNAGLFDLAWYSERNPAVILHGWNPLVHWLVSGWREGLDPHPLFRVRWYLDQNPRVAEAQVNPLVHYLDHGARDGCDPNPLFDSDWYLSQNPDVARVGLNPLVHYLRHGADEGREPGCFFHNAWYLAENPDVKAAGIEPLTHYLGYGIVEGRNPAAIFDSAWYFEKNGAVIAERQSPLDHWLSVGWKEGRSPCPALELDALDDADGLGRDDVVAGLYAALEIKHKRKFKQDSEGDYLAPIRSLKAAGHQLIGFVGTARSHKNLQGAAQAVRDLRATTGLPVLLCVLGDVQPLDLRKQLQKLGAYVGGSVPLTEVPSVLAELDAVLTGYPIAAGTADDVAKYQISAKIGDALQVGRPVLVPESPSVNDLNGISGVYLFDEEHFQQIAMDALRHHDSIVLPEQFSLYGAGKAMARALLDSTGAPRAGEVLASLRERFDTAAIPSGQESKARALLLIWKQHDAGIYGRRIDQIARTYKRHFPGHRVIVLEFLDAATRLRYENVQRSPLSDAELILDFAARKLVGLIGEDEVQYRLLEVERSGEVGSMLSEFLLSEHLLPTSTTIVLFPVVSGMESATHILSAYRVVVDVVDNQLGWQKSGRSSYIDWHYSLCSRLAGQLVFNSAANADNFLSRYCVEVSPPHALIPNWYSLPNVHSSTSKPRLGNGFHVIYSGNMNDRVDWVALEGIAGLANEVSVHLFGAAERSGDAFARLIQLDNVFYYGPRTERDVVLLLREMHLAVIPHIVDSISQFMNPLKVEMYKSVDLCCIALDVPGLSSVTSKFQIVPDRERMIESVTRHFEEWKESVATSPLNTLDDLSRYAHSNAAEGDAYVDLLAELGGLKLATERDSEQNQSRQSISGHPVRLA